MAGICRHFKLSTQSLLVTFSHIFFKLSKKGNSRFEHGSIYCDFIYCVYLYIVSSMMVKKKKKIFEVSVSLRNHVKKKFFYEVRFEENPIFFRILQI